MSVYKLVPGVDFEHIPDYLGLYHVGGAPKKKEDATSDKPTTAAATKKTTKPATNKPTSDNNKVPEQEQILLDMVTPISNTSEVLTKALFRKRKTMPELVIEQPLSGVVSLALLDTKGFTSVETIRFKSGAITEIKDIPHTVYRIFAPNNQIHTMDHFPESVEYIDLENNKMVGDVNLTRFSALKEINLSKNQITGFVSSDSSTSSFFPNTLMRLVVNDNQIRRIQLTGTPILETLNLTDNPNPIIVDMPDTVSDLRIPPGATHQSASVSASLNKASSSSSASSLTDDVPSASNNNNNNMLTYKDSLDAYYAIRATYQNKLNISKKQKITSKSTRPLKLPECVGCGRAVGMLFSSRNQKHSAVCGSASSPCPWKLVVERGNFYPIRGVLSESTEVVKQMRDNIIRQKMDTLFEYITDEKSAALFSEHIGYYRQSTETAAKYMKVYETAYFNESKASVISHKLQKIQNLVAEVEENLNAGNIKEAARIQSEEIAPISRYIHSLRYEVNEAILNEDKNGLRLVQLPVSLTRSEINLGVSVR